jgi:hypothetical protein
MDKKGRYIMYDNDLEWLEELNADVKLNLDLFKKHDGLSVSQSMQYNMVLLILYEKIKSKKIFNNYNYIKTV